MKAQYLLLAATLVAGPTFAQMAAKPAPKPATATKTTHTTTTKTTTAKPMTAQHTTKTGKTITYDCSKKGNANKTACKKK